MRKTFVALLLLLGATALSANIAAALEDADGRLAPMMRSAQMARELQDRAGRLGTSTGTDDTTWVGYTPGFFSASNYWSIYSGHGKDGYMRPVFGQPDKGNWNWDAPVNGDSLQGWIPVRSFSTEGGPVGSTDRLRPHTCISFGNTANLTIAQGRGANWQNRANGTESGWRTPGVDGVWHRDAGSNVTVSGVPAPTWTPIAGGFSAWMGLRAHADNTHLDPLTGQSFNQNVLVYNGGNTNQPGFTNVQFPGYGTAMDQMLYRDIDMAGKLASDLTVSFKYRTNLSTAGLTGTARFGWFHHDPLAPTCGATNPQPNNFISGVDAGIPGPLGGAPVDSFMVYVGSGVDGNQWYGSDGNYRDVYDPKHRWFAEVLHSEWDPGSDPANPLPLYYKQLLSVTGTVGTATDGGTVASYTIPNATLAPFLAKNGKIRLVFRVHTNLFFDDERVDQGFSSGGWGAVQVDDVSYQIGANPVVNFGDFESASAINNDPAVSALDAWKSTGKPPSAYQHVEQYDNVVYEDLCGPVGSARICDLQWGIISVGDHDNGEAAGGLIDCQAEFDWRDDLMSPTIQFVDDDANPNTKNVHGLYGIGGNGGQGDIVGTEDIYIREDVYTGVFAVSEGSYWRFGMQSYPAVPVGAPVGYQTWSHIQRTGFIFFESTGKLCYGNLYGASQFSLIRTSNANGIPDSLRIALEYLQLCFAFGVSGTCAPTDGGYRDNAALAIVDGTPALVAVDIWDWFQDTFPANESAGFPGNAALFDTTTAYIKVGINNAQDTNDQLRYNIPGDSVIVQSATGTTRMDMVFRILPGPGNYHPIGDGHNGYLRRIPTNPATVTPGDGSWWDVYRTNPGEYASPNAASLLTNGKAGWDPNVWVSARCDTLEANIYALQGRGVLGGPGNPTLWMTTYHESDKRYDVLGIVKNRCFVRCEACALTDIKCDGTLPDDYAAGADVTTEEFTKIIPDGLLTPGSHVQYFFRSSFPGAMIPDTNTVSPQLIEGPSTDGHRWQEFSVLPDRWKDPNYLHPVFQTFGRGPACLLVIDWNDRRGNEQRWVGVADTIGATAPEKFGAHNGWHAAGTASVNDPAGFVRQNGGSPGTTWDMYQIKGSESIDTASGTIGSRYANRAGDPLATNKSARNAPTDEMLDAYYTLMLILSGDLSSNMFGPFTNKSDDDIGTVEGWLQRGDTENQNRGIWAMGDGFVESLTLQANGPPQLDLIQNYFRADLVSEDYQHFAGNNDGTADIRVFPEWQGKDVAQIYGLRNACLWTTDVLTTSSPLLTSETAQYEQKGAPVNGFYAGIFKDWDPASPWKALVDGWDIEHLTTRNDVTTVGRSLYFYKIFNNVWSKIWAVAGTPIVPLDVPSFDDASLVNFVNVAGNPMYASAKATIKFGLAKADRVEINVYDVGGRLIRTLADRNFAPGTHDVVWDGMDNGGRQVARGVYFTQVKFANQRFSTARKLTVLK
jgi:hypothetical protein